jgi:uncharacterized membrane protein YgdD (TMEM256/DUF423 family)
VTTSRLLVGLGACLAGTAVALGAFATHGLEGRLPASLLEAFATGARLQMSHGLALVALAWAADRWPGARLALGGWLLAAGTVIFSGSLYLMALSGQRWLGAVTPVGGLMLLAGWTVVAWRCLRGDPTGR